MATDAVGFSRLMHDDEDRTTAALRAAHQVLSDEAANRAGRIFSRAGDSALVEFSSSIDALKAGLAFQHQIGLRNKRLPRRRRMEFRVGINLGTAIIEGTDLLGDCVNVASRLEGLAEPGGICVSAPPPAPPPPTSTAPSGPRTAT